MDSSPSFQRKIGLTGGIASGKTTAAQYLATVHGLPILDADIYARDAVAPGSEIWQLICDRYGSEILISQPPASPGPAPLDRAKLGSIVFADSVERRWLEAQIHPYVGHRFDQAIASHAQAAILILVIPLLFEARLTHRVTETWVVNCTAAQQRQRLMERNRLTVAEAEARITAQMPLSEKCHLADVVLDNSHSTKELNHQIDRLLGQSLP